MIQKTYKWLILSLFFSLVLSSCKKEKMAKMKRGKYEMINIRTFPGGEKDTISCFVYGPRVLEHHYYFTTEVDNKVIDEIDIGVNRRRMLTKGPFAKRVESTSIRFYSDNFALPGYFGGPVDSYDLQESKLTMNYSNSGNSYTASPEEAMYTGYVEFNWVEP